MKPGDAIHSKRHSPGRRELRLKEDRAAKTQRLKDIAKNVEAGIEIDPFRHLFDPRSYPAVVSSCLR